jgi:hypothetical protein
MRRSGEVERQVKIRQLHGTDIAAIARGRKYQLACIRSFAACSARNQHEKSCARPAQFAQSQDGRGAVGLKGERIFSRGNLRAAPTHVVGEHETSANRLLCEGGSWSEGERDCCQDGSVTEFAN